MHIWHYAKQVIGPSGTLLELDIATKTKTRPSMANVRVEIDLLKPLHTSVYVGAEDESIPLNGYVQKIKWENVPKYCKPCKKLGYFFINYLVVETIKQEEIRKKK